MTVITDIKTALEDKGYNVFLHPRTKLNFNDLVIVLSNFDYEVESPKTYLVDVTLDIWTEERSTDKLINKILTLSDIIESGIKGNMRFKLLSPEIYNDEGSLYKVVIPIKYTEVMNIE